MTYNVFGGTLNLAQSIISSQLSQHTFSGQYLSSSFNKLIG